MNPGVARGGVVLPVRRRRRRPPKPASPARRVLAGVLAALATGVGVHFATHHGLTTSGSPLPSLETGNGGQAALNAWTDSAGFAAARGRRLERLAAACVAEPRERRQAVLDSFPEWPDDVLALVACHRIGPNLTARQLLASWGKPVRIVPDLSGLRPVEQWDYGERSVLLWDSRVRSWQ